MRQEDPLTWEGGVPDLGPISAHARLASYRKPAKKFREAPPLKRQTPLRNLEKNLYRSCAPRGLALWNQSVIGIKVNRIWGWKLIDMAIEKSISASDMSCIFLLQELQKHVLVRR